MLSITNKTNLKTYSFNARADRERTETKTPTIGVLFVMRSTLWPNLWPSLQLVLIIGSRKRYRIGMMIAKPNTEVIKPRTKASARADPDLIPRAKRMMNRGELATAVLAALTELTTIAVPPLKALKTRDAILFISYSFIDILTTTAVHHPYLSTRMLSTFFILLIKSKTSNNDFGYHEYT